jgi:hypothetical protein
MEDDGLPLRGHLRQRSSGQVAVLGHGRDARRIDVDVRMVDVGEDEQGGLGWVC